MALLGKLLETGDGLRLLVSRATLGIVMLPHGAQKLLGWFDGPGLGNTVAGFRDAFGASGRVLIGIVMASRELAVVFVLLL